ncbi:PREDICTED: F-box protein At5g07610-like [Fragaria vesca subsp. vesca]|uniref:F-box protein At5g07610-like n=1 Tax=Fragaria vesca subsp. vesca TaxID=101020 RepID=UPI0002C31EE9|nr:PREDICTED: F-box protein At5g07610-like [Fragaria vesca subsp. vesca]
MHFDESCREGAVYCNGGVHWIRDRMQVGLCWSRTRIGDSWSKDTWIRNDCDVLHYFDVGEEQFRLAPATPPPVPLVAKDLSYDINYGWPRFDRICFGDCGGRLYLIESFQYCKTRFEVMEMERDYSGWLVKYRVDLNPLVAAYPGEDWDACVVLGLSQEDKTDNGVEDTSTDLLLHLPGKIISYNLRNETFKTSAELGNEELFQAFGDNHGIEEAVTFPYMETLACL